MAEGIQIRGVVAQIKWSYYNAAAIHGYTVQRNKQTGVWSLVGTVVASDAFKLRQRPLVFVAPHRQGTKERAWRWTIESHEIINGTVRATLSPFQE